MAHQGRAIDPAAEEKYRRELFRQIHEKAEKHAAWQARNFKPPKPAPESPAADHGIFWPLAILTAIGMMIMTAVTARERPEALLPLWLFFGAPAFIALGVSARQIFVKPRPAMPSVAVRWFTAYGICVAAAIAVMAVLNVRYGLTAFFGAFGG